MQDKRKRYSVPDTYTVIPKDEWFIFFDPVNFAYTRVNEDGKAILESVGSENSADAVSRTVAGRYGMDIDGIEDQVAAFLENMTATGFLHEGPYRPNIDEPTAPEKEKPKSLYISPTFRCNLNCIYCYNREDRISAAAPELTAREWFDALDRAKDLGVKSVAFTGGEPLLRKDVLDIARYAADIGLPPQILTNATLIHDGNIDDIAGSFGSFALSLDSHIKEKNDFLRGRGAYEKTIRAARLLQERQKTFTIAAVITRHNVAEIPGLYKFCLEELNCTGIMASPIIPATLGDVALLPEIDDYLNALNEIARVVEDHYGGDETEILKFHGKPGRHIHCGAAAAELSIDADGSVYPCQALHKDEFRGGNVKDTNLTDIYYNSPVMQRIRDLTVDKIETCRDCHIKTACGGGCRSLAYNLEGRIDGCSPYMCDYLKTLTYNAFFNATRVPIDRLRHMQTEDQPR